MPVYAHIDKLIQKPLTTIGDYSIIDAAPATGILYIKNNFLSGHIRLRGRGGGQYPFNYLEMIDAVFGKAEITIEACSGKIKGDINTTTVDLASNYEGEDAPDIVADAQNLDFLPVGSFARWRCDPPYNERTARQMYDCKMPSLYKLLQAGARVVIPGALLFLLCSQNYQICPLGLRRIGFIAISVVPLNEVRGLNVFQKAHKDRF